MRKVRINIRESVFNPVYMPYYKCDARHLHLYGGAGSGKSVYAAQKILLRLLKEPGHRILIIRKVARTIRRSMFQLLRDIIIEWNLGALFTINKVEMEIHCINGGSIIAAGVDDPEKLKSIHGVTMIWIEEATELWEADFNQIDLRLRGMTSSYKQIILSYNPISESHWINQRFHQNHAENSVILKTTYKDNRFIDPEYAAQLQRLAEIDETFYQIYALGEWATPTDLIYPNWITTSTLPDSYDEILYGLDFGFNAPTALVEIGLRDQIPYVRELLYQTKMTNGELIEKMKELIPNPNAFIYADSAEPARIEEIYRSGFNIHPADKRVASGIDTVKRFRVHVDEGSDNIIRERRTYKWRKDKSGMVLDEPVKMFDHTLDAIRYAVATHSAIYWGQALDVLPSATSSTRRPRRFNLFEGY